MRTRRPPSSSSTVECPTHVARTPSRPVGPSDGCCATAPRYSGENGSPCRPPPPPPPPRPRCCPRCASGATSCSRRSCWRRWRASPTAPSAGCAGSTARRVSRPVGVGGASGATSLYVSEMVTTRALVERTPETMRLISHDPDEHPRSVQLYSVDPVTAGLAARLLVTEDRADHIDLNFGCPVPKVTRKGGGAALPWKTELFRGIVAAVVREAQPYDVPVTVKMRVGIDADHVTYLDAGRIAEGEGAAAVALHGRTAAQAYSGQADWSAIARLKEAVTSVPGARQRRHLVGRGRPGDGAADRVRRGRRGAWLPRPAVAVHRPGGGVRRVRRAGAARAARGHGHAAPARGLPRRVLRRRRGSRLPRHPQAHRLVPQGVPGRVDGAQPARPGRQPAGARRPDRHDGPRRTRGPARPPRASAAGPGRRGSWPCPRTGCARASSTTPSAPRSPRPSSASPAADPGHPRVKRRRNPGHDTDISGRRCSAVAPAAAGGCRRAALELGHGRADRSPRGPSHSCAPAT